MTSQPTTVVNVRLDLCDCYIGRKGVGGSRHMLNTKAGEPGWLGNPFRPNEGDAIGRFRLAFKQRLKDDGEFRLAVLALRGKRLGCWCAGKDGLTADGPVKCHGQVIAAFVDSVQ